MTKELPLLDKKIKELLKDSELSNFDKLVLALVKFYPEFKKQRELSLEAGITESELSGWIRGRRGKKYEEFFDKYCDYDKKIKGWRLKVHEDLVDRFVEIVRKDERAKEIIVKSKYYKEFIEKLNIDNLRKLLSAKLFNDYYLDKIVSKDLQLLLYGINKNFLNLEKAKEIFLKMLEAKGMTKDEIIKKLNISEKALSCYTKLYLNFLLNKFRILGNILFEDLNLDRIIEDIERGKPSFDTSFLNLGWVLAVNLMEVFSGSWGIIDEFMFPVPHFTDKPYLYHCSGKELDQLFSWLAKKEKYNLGTLPADLFDNYLLEKAGKPLRVRKWVRICCTCLLLEFDLKGLIKGENSAKFEITSYLRDAQCPIDKSECDLDVSERFHCPKFKEFLKEVIEK